MFAMKKPIDIKLTKEGFENLKKELARLQERRPGVVVRLSAAREQGDLSENAGYHAAKEELGKIDSRVNEIKLILRFGDVVEATNSEIVQVGSSLVAQSAGENFDFSIVGELEANPIAGKLSKSSPIGKALIGKRPGEEVEIETPSGKVTYKVVKIK